MFREVRQRIVDYLNFLFLVSTKQKTSAILYPSAKLGAAPMHDVLQKIEGPFFRLKKAAAYVDCSEVTLRRMVADGLLPAPIRVGARKGE